MTTEQLEEAFDNCDESGGFDSIDPKFSKRPDLHAMILLDKLLPGTDDMVSASEHDQYWLAVDMEKLAEVATPEIVRQLSICGCMFDYDGLSLFA